MVSPVPVAFEPIIKPRPWGGRGLAQYLGKRLPDGVPCGESWELVSLPGDESRVRGGPAAGATLSELVAAWGARLTGQASLVDGRFPLLIKFLDAAQDLSVQAHPRPESASGVKHEAWYVIHAEPGARVYIGTREGVTTADLRATANSAAIVDLLRAWPATAGDCFYLPSGTPHALGAGVLVAEVQTPSDVTYRLYDWGRVGLDGQPRELHVEAALANLVCGVPAEVIVQPRRPAMTSAETQLMCCDRFRMTRLRMAAGYERALHAGDMAVWIVVSGRGALRRDGGDFVFGVGDVVLIPADTQDTRIEATADCDVLEVTVPTP